jgi:hypothetical protein
MLPGRRPLAVVFGAALDRVFQLANKQLVRVHGMSVLDMALLSETHRRPSCAVNVSLHVHWYASQPKKGLNREPSTFLYTKRYSPRKDACGTLPAASVGSTRGDYSGRFQEL